MCMHGYICSTSNELYIYVYIYIYYMPLVWSVEISVCVQITDCIWKKNDWPNPICIYPDIWAIKPCLSQVFVQIIFWGTEFRKKCQNFVILHAIKIIIIAFASYKKWHVPEWHLYDYFKSHITLYLQLSYISKFCIEVALFMNMQKS